MDPREDRVNGEAAATKDVGEIESEIESLRDEIDRLVSELDRRRHEAFGAVAAIRTNPLPLVLGGIALGGLAAWWVYSTVQARRDAGRFWTKARKLRTAIARAIDDPDRVAAGDPTFLQQVATRLLTTAGTAVVTAMLKLVLDRVPSPEEQRAAMAPAP